ncbi:MAG: cytochrome c biogenesis protein CcsA [Candidatus Methylomirabilales bacterium]
MDLVFFYAALILYLGGTGGYLVLLFVQRAHISAFATASTLGGLSLHTVAILARLYLTGRPPLATVYEALSFFAWATALVYLFLEFRFQKKLMGSFVLPIVLLFTFIAAVVPKEGVGPDRVPGAWIWLHVGLVFLGTAAFALTFCVGLMYLIQERLLKSKRLSPVLFRLPALEFLDRLAYKTLAIGFPLLTAGLIVGAVQAHARWGSYFSSWDPTQVLSVITWLIYAMLLQARLTAGWRGRKAAILSIIGFGALVMTVLGVNVMSRGLTAFH